MPASTTDSADDSGNQWYLHATGSRRAILAAALGALAAAGAACAPSSEGTASTSPTTGGLSPTADEDIAELPAEQILALGVAALAGAKSYQVTGHLLEAGTRFEFTLQTMGPTYVQGQFTASGSTVELLRNGDHIYVQVPEPFWRFVAPDRNIPFDKVDGEWVRFPVDFPTLAMFGAFGDPNAFFMTTRPLTKGERQTFKGKEAIALDTNEGVILTVSTDRANPAILQFRAADDTCEAEFNINNADISTYPPPDDFVEGLEVIGSSG
jgi:hypothetical protein